jgi:hypothetical protein
MDSHWHPVVTFPPGAPPGRISTPAGRCHGPHGGGRVRGRCERYFAGKRCRNHHGPAPRTHRSASGSSRSVTWTRNSLRTPAGRRRAPPRRDRIGDPREASKRRWAYAMMMENWRWSQRYWVSTYVRLALSVVATCRAVDSALLLSEQLARLA